MGWLGKAGRFCWILAGLQAQAAQGEARSCRQHFTSVFHRANPLWVSSRVKEVSSGSFEIFEKVRANPRYVLNREERRRVGRENLTEVLEVYRNSARTLRELNRWVALWQRSMPHPELRGWRKLAESWKLLLPEVASPTRYRAQRIFEKVLHEPDAVLTDSDRKFIEKWNLADELQRFREDLATQADLYQVFTRIRKVGSGLKATSIAGVLGSGVALQPDRMISLEKSFDPEDPDGMSIFDDKVELIFESPAPHMAIRVGGLIYSYGLFRVERMTLPEYRRQQEESFLGTSANHTRIELRVSPEKRRKLRKILDREVGRFYPLLLPYNDCVSEGNKALREALGIDVPPVVDRSPAGTIHYFKIRKLLGAPEVGPVRFASRDGSGSGGSYALELGVNAVDTAFFLSNAGRILLVSPWIDGMNTTLPVNSRPQR